MKNFFFATLLFIIGMFSSTAKAKETTTNFFISDTYEKEGLSFEYSGVVKFNTSSTSAYNSDISFEFYLASFYIEEVTYQGISYRNHELFGYTFPKEVLSKINIEVQFAYKASTILITTDVSSFDKTYYKLSKTEINNLKKETLALDKELESGKGVKLNLLKTNSILFPINKDLVNDILEKIKSNTSLKTKQETEQEYFRLVTEGNLFLNENNYRESLISYKLAKRYTEDPEYVSAKIDVVDSYLKKNRTENYRWNNNKTKNSTKTTKQSNSESVKDKKRYTKLYEAAEELFKKRKYNKALEKYKEANLYTNNKIILESKIKEVEKIIQSKEQLIEQDTTVSIENKTDAIVKTKRSKNTIENDVPTSVARKTSVFTVDEKLSYPELLKKGSELLGAKEYIKSKAYFEAAREKTTNKATVDRILVSVNKLAKSQSTTYKLVEKSPVVNNPVTTKLEINDSVVTKSTIVKSNKSKEVSILEGKAEVLKAEFGEGEYRKGFIKFKRDEQAVFDAFDEVLIPFGKYEILRYRAGFANVRLKDTVALKTIECKGKNYEYSWSARIYQNPWIETVVDKNGSFVDAFKKRVEIYVVDNVSLLPWEEVPQQVKDAYKDPNQYTGTEFVSAFKLWEKENADRPDIIARRKEIQNFKNTSKREAYSGANKCKEEVAQSIEAVYTYFRNLGYEIIVKY